MKLFHLSSNFVCMNSGKISGVLMFLLSINNLYWYLSQHRKFIELNDFVD